MNMNQKCTILLEKNQISGSKVVYIYLIESSHSKFKKKKINKQWDSPPVDKTVVSPQTFGKNKNMH